MTYKTSLSRKSIVAAAFFTFLMAIVAFSASIH